MKIQSLIMLATVVLCPLIAQAATPQHFEVKQTKDIIELCSVSADDPLYVAAIHFCHGYLVGAYRYHEASTAGPGQTPTVCPPDPKPSRNEAIGMFVNWVKAHPQYMNERPVDTLARFLNTEWSCEKGKAEKGKANK